MVFSFSLFLDGQSVPSLLLSHQALHLTLPVNPTGCCCHHNGPVGSCPALPIVEQPSLIKENKEDSAS